MPWVIQSPPYPFGSAGILRSRTVRRVRLGRAALQYAGHGWPVTPGACYAGSRFICGRLGCPIQGCHPALEHWEQAATDDRLTVAAWWRDAPHTVLLVTGRVFDALEVPAHLGAAALEATVATRADAGPHRDAFRGPVAVTPTGRWMFLVRPGAALRRELRSRLDVVHHGRGSWVPAPPARLLEGLVRWAVSPEETAWRLPEPERVQRSLVEAALVPRPWLARRAVGLADPRPVGLAGQRPEAGPDGPGGRAALAPATRAG